MDQSKVEDFVKFHTKRKITLLFTTFLNQLEDLRADGLEIPEEKYQRIRKRILDNGNDCMRDLETLLARLSITLKE